MNAEQDADRSAVGRLFRQFLAALNAPHQGAELLELHAAEASLFCAGKTVGRDAVDRADFVAFHHTATLEVLAAGNGFPSAAEARLTEWAPVASNSHQAVAGFEVNDPVRNEPLWVAVGVVREDAEWRIAWTTLMPGLPWPNDGVGRALSLAEFPFIQFQASPRHWLDVAYRRRFHGARPALAILPDERFACQGSGICCRAAWEVTLPPSAQDFIDALPYADFAPELAGTQLEPKGDGQLILKKRDEACRFLDENFHCRVHKLLGGPVFTPCVVFPYTFTETPDGIAVTTRRYCSGARGGFGPTLASQTDEIHHRVGQAGAMVAVGRLALVAEREVDWPTFKTAESELLEALRLDDLPLHRRLWMGSRMLEARAEGRVGDLDDFALEPLTPLSPTEQALVDTYLAYPISVLASLHPEFEAAQTRQFKGTRLKHEATAARWFENVLFAKEYAYAFDLATAHALLVMLYVFQLSVEQALGGREADEKAMVILYTCIDHGMIMQPLRQLFELVPALRALVETPHGAQLFLRHVHASARAAASAGH